MCVFTLYTAALIFQSRTLISQKNISINSIRFIKKHCAAMRSVFPTYTGAYTFFLLYLKYAHTTQKQTYDSSRGVASFSRLFSAKDVRCVFDTSKKNLKRE